MEIKLIGKTTILRSICLEDSDFVSTLRSEPSIYQFLSSDGELTLQQQKDWLFKFLNKSNDFYFIIEDKRTNKRVGTISLYNLNIEERKAEFGRFICLNPVNAIESELMILNLAFKILMYDRVYCRTAEENLKVWNQHYKFGFSDLNFEFLDVIKKLKLRVQEISKDDYYSFDYQSIINLVNNISK